MSRNSIEKITETKILLRVNLTKGTFLALRNNCPLTEHEDRSLPIVHKLPYIVFIGEELFVKSTVFHESEFFPVVDNFLKIPFGFQSESDIRHLHLPIFLPVDVLPAVLVYYHKPSIIGSLAEALKGALYFVTHSENNQAELLKLKIRFPHARLVLFEKEKEIFVDRKQDDLMQGALGKIRVTDITNEKEALVLSQNPVFAARIYLRQMEWEKMKVLPFSFLMQDSDIQAILIFLRVMKDKAVSNDELLPEIEQIAELMEYYRILEPFFAFDSKKTENFFLEGVKEFELLQFLRKVFFAQLKLLKRFPDRRKENFFLRTLGKIDEICPLE